MNYSFEYKCRICGAVIAIGAIDTNETTIISQLSKTLYTEGSMNGLTGERKMITLHHCDNGSIGYADLIGAVN